MCKALKTLMLTSLLSACLIVTASAESVPDINSLIDNAKAFDNKTVTVEGEAIGETLERGEYSWVNISDGSNAIGIWMKSSDAERIENFGAYEHIGDTLVITGLFSRDCKEHGGDVDIHSVTLEIVKRGGTVKTELPRAKLFTAGALFCAALLSAYVYRKIVKKKKSK